MPNTSKLRSPACPHRGERFTCIFLLLALGGWAAATATAQEPAWDAPACQYNFFVDQDDDPVVADANAACLTKGGGDCSLREALTALQDVNQNYQNVNNYDGQNTNGAYGVDDRNINCIYIQPLANSTDGDATMITLNGATDLPTINYGVRIMPDRTVDATNSANETVQEPTSTTELITINGNGRRIFNISIDSSYSSWVDIRQLVLKNGGATDGGLIMTDSSTQIARLYQCTLTRDAALPDLNPGGTVRGTAVYVHDNVDLYMDRCTVAGIKANLDADVKGTIHVEGNGELFITNSTISGNQAASGSAIYGRGAVTITQSTITNNTGQSTYNNSPGDNCENAAGRGAAVFMEKSVSDLLAINNTLITGNINNFNPPQAAPVCSTEADCFLEVINGNPTITPLSRCSLYDDLGNCGTNASDQQLDPTFTLGPLQNNGGLTPTHRISIDDPANNAVDGVDPNRDPSCSCTPSGTQCRCAAIIDQPGSDRPAGSHCDVGAVEDPSVPTCPGTRPVSPRVSPGQPDLGSHTTPTYLFIASYDWLHHFTDRNASGARGSRQRDPDTDNFNKIIVADSNLFPIMTALVGDHEFPNITARNALSWRGNAAPYYSFYSPSINDYFNRSIAVAPDFIPKAAVKYSVFTTICQNTTWLTIPTFQDMYQYGARSIMQWAFVVDPGNNNLRRYQFRKLGSFVTSVVAGSPNNTITPPPGTDMSTVCNSVDEGWWFTSPVHEVFGANATRHVYLNAFGDPTHTPQSTQGDCPAAQVASDVCFENSHVMWACQHSGDTPTNISSVAELTGYINAGSRTAPNKDPAQYGYLEFLQEIPANQAATLPLSLPIIVYGNARTAASTTLVVGLNTRCGDPRPATETTTGSAADPYEGANCTAYAADSQYKIAYTYCNTNNNNCYRNQNTFTFTLTADHDLDPLKPGVQFRLRIYALGQGGFAIDQVDIGENDSAFTVNYDGPDNRLETRWSVLTSFLETVPPKSFPGYPLYTSAGRTANRGAVGLGFQTNTTFTTAKLVRFKDPRDVDVYRDMFDSRNGGPTYIFVADTGNSRIQVFMNATGVAGATNARFPVRPVRVKAPNDSVFTEYKSNELGPRVHTGVNLTAIALGDGRKGDWRQYTTVSNSATLSQVRIPAKAGRGEFYFPHSIAVDQDPDTKDVYLFVADTYNHRIQIFRDTTGVSFQGITSKRFNFVFEEGWGTYPLQTTLTATAPGPFRYRYPKGIDVARFANNSSYLYVVDAKDYRVLKYLISEGTAAQGIKSVRVIAGYGYNGATFVKDRTAQAGKPLETHRAFEENLTPDGRAAVGFLNPQEVTTGYNGFYLYSAPRAANYRYQIATNDGRPLGVQYLNNYMLYVSDYARNNTSIGLARLNMRIMQFIDHPGNANLRGEFLPWQTDPNVVLPKGRLGQSVFGFDFGLYSSVGATGAGVVQGASSNAPGLPGIFTERPVGMAALSWDTLTPFDLRVMDLTNKILYPHGATIDNDTALRVGVRAREFFGLPYRNLSTYTNFTSQEYAWDGYKIKRLHVFCYDTAGAFQNHTALYKPPFEFTPATVSAACTGYMKVIAEDKLFDHSGKTGTLIFKMTD